jgi:phosphomannomutase
MKFGTSGLRGLVSDMTDAVCEAYTAAFLDHLRTSDEGPTALLVGYDLRPSSPRIAAACRAAACRAGVTALDCGVVPTPALALEATSRSLPAVMVTGSHIPFDRNGLKFYRPGGEITKNDEQGILAALSAPDLQPKAPVGEAPMPDAGDRYMARMRAFLPAGALAGWRVGIYQHSAAGRDLIPAMLEGLGAQTVTLGRSDAFVPIDTEAVRPEDEALAREWTAAHGLDALVSTDGDGDRPLMADAEGRFLRGDLLGLLTAHALGADAVATPVSSNTALERSGWIPRVVRTRIGSPYVIEAIIRLAAEGAALPVGYEANGGFLLGGTAIGVGGSRLTALPTRDAVLPMLAVLTAAAAAGVSLADYAAKAPARATASDRLQAIEPALSGAFLAALAGQETFRARLLGALGLGGAETVDTLDGVRMYLPDDEIVHLRASGNAPELRCYAEAADAARAAWLVSAALCAVPDFLES